MLPAPPHIAVFIPSLAGGGVGRAMLHLAGAFAARGHRVDLVLSRVEGPYLAQIPTGVKLRGLQTSPLWQGRIRALSADPKALGSLLLPILFSSQPPKTLRSLPALVRYLQCEQPAVLLATQTPANLVALWARRLARVPTRVIVGEQTNLSQQITGPKRRKWRWRFIAPVIQRVYPWADAVVAVSHGVADDLSCWTSIPRERITVIYNPVVTPGLLRQAQAQLDHPWFQPGSPPVVLGAGRLTPQKDFPTLLKAFARVRAERPIRLLILGEGKQRAELRTLTAALGIAEDVSLPGFVDNPYAYMAGAALFVLSSAWEGFGNVLAEALACGCPVVSTDCPSGPAELLDHGRYGALVPVGNDEALARKILETLDRPRDREYLQARASEFSIERACTAYSQVLLGA